jgi:glutamyl-tRNA(Gln) amidotransferase subunit E
MYPDTDLPPVRIDEARLSAISYALPEPPWRRVERLREAGVGEDLAERLSRHGAYTLFAHLVPLLGKQSAISAQSLASLLVDRSCPRPPSLAAAGDWWEGTVARLARGEILPEGVWSCEGQPPLVCDETEGERLVDAALGQLPTDGSAALPQREDWAMGKIMGDLRGRVPGRRVRARVQAWLRAKAAGVSAEEARP